MRTTTTLSNIARTALVAGSLLAALAFTGATASASQTGLTECDHGCNVVTSSGTGDGLARYQSFPPVVAGTNSFTSHGAGQIGFTR